MAVTSVRRSRVVVVGSVVVVDTTSDEVVEVVDGGAVVTGAVAGVLPTVVHPPTHAAATARTTMAKDRILVQPYGS